MAKAIIWIRTSTEEQEVDTQRMLLKEKAINDGFREEDLVCIGASGASAIKMNELYQREVNELLRMIESDQDISTVYVWEVSRLARNELAFYQMKDAIIKKHIQLICDVPSIRLLDDDGEVNSGAELSLNLLVTIAKQEMTIKKKRFSRGKQRLAVQGKYNGGAIPYGYKIDRDNDNLIVEDEEEGQIVREIFNLYESGYSQPSIAKELYARGVKGRAARKTKSFTISLVHQILTNELLTGKPHKNKGASFVRKYPQIISEEQFQRCREIAEMNNTTLSKSQRVYYAHKLIECTECHRTFISTGYKGYYHCKDAYNYNKKYEGYDGVPMCKNHVCISVNIMDSLLWNLAIKFETFFIVNEASERIDAYDSNIATLQKKVEAIPERLGSIEQREARLNEVYVYNGTMKREQYQKLQASLQKERHEVQSDRAKYLRDIEHYQNLKEQAQKALETDYDVDKFLNRAEAIYHKISTITDDLERSEIIHRHIQKVTVEKTTIQQTFDIHPEGKEVTAKKITVYPYGHEQEVYYFVPYDGKGGRMLASRDYLKAFSNITIPAWEKNAHYHPAERLQPLEMTYLARVKDESKYRRREQARLKREGLESKAIEQLRKQGYISMTEMRQLSNLSYSTIYRAIKIERLKAKNLFQTWYVKKVDFLAYLEEYKPKPRPKSIMPSAQTEGKETGKE